jgi:hypothetical protein
MTRIPMKVVLDDAHLTSMDAVQKTIAAMGFQIEQCIPEIGAIYGSADEGVLKQLGEVDGVLRAQHEGAFSLAPRDPHAPQ